MLGGCIAFSKSKVTICSGAAVCALQVLLCVSSAQLGTARHGGKHKLSMRAFGIPRPCSSDALSLGGRYATLLVKVLNSDSNVKEEKDYNTECGTPSNFRGTTYTLSHIGRQ